MQSGNIGSHIGAATAPAPQRAQQRDSQPALPLARMTLGAAIGGVVGVGASLLASRFVHAPIASNPWMRAGAALAGGVAGAALAAATASSNLPPPRDTGGHGIEDPHPIDPEIPNYGGGIDVTGSVTDPVTPPASGKRTDAAPPTKPNIVFVITDDQTYDQVRNAMPNVAGRDDWIEFDNASISTPLCCPSRTTILTGQTANHTGIDYLNGNDFNDSSTLATWLDDAGYETGLFGKYLNSYGLDKGYFIPPGWDEWHSFVSKKEYGRINGGYFNYAMNHNGNVVVHGNRDKDYSTDVLGRAARNFIRDNADDEQPFFMYFAPYSTHGPRTPAPRHEDAFNGTPMPRFPGFNEEDVSDKPQWVQNLEPRNPESMDKLRRASYKVSLSADDQIGKLFDTIKEQGLEQDTVVVFMTDNGYAFGEHRWSTKRTAHETSTQTPLLMRIPGVSARHINEPVANYDIASTIADLAGVTPELPQDGSSIVPLVYGDNEGWRDGVLLRWAGGDDQGEWKNGKEEVPEFWGWRTPEWKYVEYPDTGEYELYDLGADPNELNNLASNSAYAGIMSTLDAQMEAARARLPQPPRAPGDYSAHNAGRHPR